MAADIVLEKNSTRVIDVLDVASNPSRSPEITVDPSGSGSITLPNSGSSVEAGSATLQDPGILTLQNQSGDRVVRGDASGTGGTVTLSSGDSQAEVNITTTGQNGELSMDSGKGATGIVSINTANGVGELSLTSPLGPEVVNLTADTTSDYRSGGGGIVFRHKRLGTKQVTARTKDPGAGQITVHSKDGKRTGSLDGEDAALVLAGLPEDNRRDQSDPAFGGGELVLQQGVDQGDIQLHAKGEKNSAYGLEGPRNHRPRILLDGPNATAELGRPTQGPNAEAASGRLLLRGLKTRADRPLFEANAVDQDAKRDKGWRRSEAIFRFTDSPDYVLDRGGGAIRAFENGLMVYAGGKKTLFVKDNGDVLVRGQLKTGQGSNLP